MEEILKAILTSQANLQTAVVELCRATGKPKERKPKEVLTKLTPDDDVETYITLFERAATREKWPRAEWANNLMPFLTGEAQKACRDLSAADAVSFDKVKTAILAQYGLSLPAKAQRVHDWSYDPALPVRAQVMGLVRLTRSWLEEAEGPPIVDRVVIDRCIRGLPNDAKRYVAQQGPPNVDTLVALLENHRVMASLMRSENNKPNNSKAKTEREMVGKAFSSPPARTPSGWTGPAARRTQWPPVPRCFSCGKEGHLARECPDRDEPMPTAGSTDNKGLYCHHLTTCWAHEGAPAPKFPVKIAGRDTEALLDSGSMVSLVRPQFASAPWGEELPVSCIHGDTRKYPTSKIEVITPRGRFALQVGVVEQLPVPVLFGRDSPLFSRYWPAKARDPKRRTKKRPVKIGKSVTRPAWAAISPDGSPAETSDDDVGKAVHTQTTATDPERAAEVEPLEDIHSDEVFSQFPEVEMEEGLRPGQFGSAQLRDPNLTQAWRDVQVIEGQKQDGVSQVSFPHFMIKDKLLYRVTKKNSDICEQLLIPKEYASKVLYLAHSHLLGAHLGREKTYERVLSRFYWPGVKRAVEEYCRHCAECQINSPKVEYRSPLIPLPIIETPFSRIGMDIVGPLPKSSRGHRYILVILDYATRYPEAIPLRSATGKVVAREMFLLFSRVGLPEGILTDQGSCFMSKVMKCLCQSLKVKQIRTSVYHPQTDGLVERFNKTLKHMLRKVIAVDGKNWDQLLPYVLFSIREVPQGSTGFSPFELLYGRRPRGLLDVAKEAWEQQPSTQRSIVEHVEQMHHRMTQVWPLVREHMQQAQAQQAQVYNRGAQVREFKPGDKVMVLIPTNDCKFLAKWQGPYEILERVGPVNYRVRQTGRRKAQQLYHVNLLKPWREPLPVPSNVLVANLPPQVLPPVKMGDQLSSRQGQDLRELLDRNRDVFSEAPGRTTVIAHDIRTEPGKTVRLRPYRIPEARREAIRNEVRKMLDLGVVEESHSAWSSPIVLVGKPDGSIRFCNDYRKLNEISLFDTYPMPRVDELVERLGPARFISTLDLTKGYWQVPLTPQAREKTAFSTPDGAFHYRVLPFGLHGAPATFQRLMDKVLRPHQDYAAAYLDDIVIHSTSWENHLQHLEAVLQALREAGLTANPAKCSLALEEANYLGYTVGRGNVKPQVKKVDAITTWPQPQTKRQVRTFLGLVGYYRQFIPNFASLAAPLHELTSKSASNRVKWTEQTQRAFNALKKALCSETVLHTPDFGKRFVLQTDASEVGLGAVLSQVHDGSEYPITFVSRKLLPHEKNYATIEKECLAVKWAIGKLRYHLLGREFTLVTDHAPLKWMAFNKDRNARITRWFLHLQDFKFTVEHRAGRLHGNADAMSRRDDCLWSAAPHRGSELRGGVCDGPAGEQCPTWLSAAKRRRLRGMVVDGRYYPRSFS